MFRSCAVFKSIRIFSSSLHTLPPWTSLQNANPIKVTSASGIYLHTADNKKIVDFTSGLMVVNLGHQNFHVMDGIQKHLNSGIGYINSLFETDEREKLSGRLLELTNNKDGKVFYTNGGADSNETAVFVAREYNHKHGYSHKKEVLTFHKSFHGGSTIGATILSGDSRRAPKADYYHLPFRPIMQNPSMRDNGEDSLDQIRVLFESGNVGAILIEGSSGSAGCILYPDGYLKKLEQMCREHKIILICDEVMSGWGRTGALFGYQKHGIQPDIITMAKGFTNGYVPFGAVVFSQRIISMYESTQFTHGLTYFAHPLACVVANRCIDEYTKNDKHVIKQGQELGDYMNKLGKKLQKELISVADYRSNGLLGCIELQTENEIHLGRISGYLIKNGVYCFRRGNLIFTAPPLIITKKEIRKVFEKIHKVLTDYEYYINNTNFVS